MDALEYWQTVGQREQAELIELMEWWEARRDQFNQNSEETESCSFEKQNAAKQN